MRKDAIPALGKKRAGDVEPSDISEIVDQMIERDAPASARLLISYLKALFNYAIDEPHIAKRFGVISNPCNRLGRKRRGGRSSLLTSEPGKRFLSNKEIVEVWKKLDLCRMDADVKIALKLILLTGARGDEVRHATWDKLDLDGEEPLWTNPINKVKGKTNLVPLSPLAVKLWQSARLLTDDPLQVFPRITKEKQDSCRPEALSKEAPA